MIVYGLWHGGHSYSVGEIPRDLEVFPSLKAAGRALLDRYENNGWRHSDFAYADGRTESSLLPAVDRESCEMWVYLYDPRETHDPYPDRRLTLGSRLGIRVERC